MIKKGPCHPTLLSKCVGNNLEVGRKAAVDDRKLTQMYIDKNQQPISKEEMKKWQK